jgi:hypothetical protein
VYVNAKVLTVEPTPRMGWRRLKENGRGGESMNDMFDTL